MQWVNLCYDHKSKIINSNERSFHQPQTACIIKISIKQRKSVLVQIFTVSASAVRIMNLGVPASYVLDENFCRPLILDCDYEFRVSDVGFVLKWYHNNHLIYQWIPPRKPYMFVSASISNQKHVENQLNSFCNFLFLERSKIPNQPVVCHHRQSHVQASCNSASAKAKFERRLDVFGFNLSHPGQAD